MIFGDSPLYAVIYVAFVASVNLYAIKPYPFRKVAAENKQGIEEQTNL